MSRNQLVFDDMFAGHQFGPRADFSPRRWQADCFEHFLDARDSHGGGQSRFTVCAGTGSGKTRLAGLIASYSLNARIADQIVFVCPNRSIRRRTQSVFRQDFGLELVAFNARKHADGIPRTKQGYLVTYGHMSSDPTLHRRICLACPTLVIFDEVHHLGDNGWGAAAVEAFGTVGSVLSLTGTPYRLGGDRIEFVRYRDSDDGLSWFSPDFNYTLGKAVAAGDCRKPHFFFSDALVKIRPHPEAAAIHARFSDTEVTEFVAQKRLAGAARYGSTPRKRFLAEALERCRSEGRKVAIFLGGDTEGDHTPTMDAVELLPMELMELGIQPQEFTVVTGDDEDSQDKIEGFGASGAWILVSINMVSEGTDIPEISAAIFLTSITAKLTTVQRIGRALRLMGESDPFKTALIFMFADPRLLELAGEIEAEIKAEIEINARKQARQQGSEGERSQRSRAEAIGIDGGEIETVIFAGKPWPISVFRDAESRVHTIGLPRTMLAALLLLTEQENGRNDVA